MTHSKKDTTQNQSKLCFSSRCRCTHNRQKSQDRQDVRPDSTMQEPVWDFLFEVIYQSSDETDSEDDVDPDTDTSTSDEIKVKPVSRDWVTRPPAYRHTAVSPPKFLWFLFDIEVSFQVAGAVKQLTKLIEACRVKDSKNGDKPRNRPHGRRLGALKEKPLPFPGKTKPISPEAINEIWLQQNQENKTARLIYGYTEEEPDEFDADMGYADEEEGFEEEGRGSQDEDDWIDPTLRGDVGHVSCETFGSEGLAEEDEDNEGLLSS